MHYLIDFHEFIFLTKFIEKECLLQHALNYFLN